jgi:hypothetical protein
MKILTTFVLYAFCALSGATAAYFLWAYANCTRFPQNNLCGLPAVFIAAPIGFVLGLIGAWSVLRRK